MLLARLCESQDVKNMKNLFAVVIVLYFLPGEEKFRME